MSSNGSHFKLIYHDDMIYEGWINYKFTLVHNGILVST